MKTVINAKIIFITDKNDIQFWSANFNGPVNIELLTMQKVAEVIKSGDFEIFDVLRNELMNDQEITIVMRHKDTSVPSAGVGSATAEEGARFDITYCG